MRVYAAADAAVGLDVDKDAFDKFRCGSSLIRWQTALAQGRHIVAQPNAYAIGKEHLPTMALGTAKLLRSHLEVQLSKQRPIADGRALRDKVILCMVIIALSSML